MPGNHAQLYRDGGSAAAPCKDAKARSKSLQACSFDKSFHSPKNQARLTELLTLCRSSKEGEARRKTTETRINGQILRTAPSVCGGGVGDQLIKALQAFSSEFMGMATVKTLM
jgi:hypothetical protein